MRVTNRSGFTLVELLIVVVVIGILATIAIPKFSAMREKSYIAAVTSDLKNLASQQEIYLSNNYTYSTAIADLDLLVTTQVSITIAEATGQGWAATGTHTGLSGRQCGMFFGNANPAGAVPATTPGSVVCN